MVIQLFNAFISVIQSAINMFFSLEIDDGVSLGWIFIVVIVMFFLHKFFLGGENNG